MTTSSKGTWSIMKKGVVVFLLVILVVLVYGFLFGPLFPYSPVKFGFSKLELKRGTVFYPKETRLSDDYFRLDSLISETETFHKLRFKKNVKVIVCATRGQYKRFSTQSAHACAMLTGTIIYINPGIKNTGRDLTGFLKHELSHAILYQNTSIFKALRFKSWLREGLAVYYGNPHHYYNVGKFLELSVDKGYFFDALDEKAKIDNIPESIRYFYVYGEYRSFVEYIVNAYGLEAFWNFTHAYIKNPKSEKQLFKDVFGTNLVDTFNSFRKTIESERDNIMRN